MLASFWSRAGEVTWSSGEATHLTSRLSTLRLIQLNSHELKLKGRRVIVSTHVICLSGFLVWVCFLSARVSDRASKENYSLRPLTIASYSKQLIRFEA
jgi:hypothetical protein